MGFKKKTVEDFIRDAKKIHGDKYDYSKVEYRGFKECVTIICPEHGEFKQTPKSHLSGRGCKECGNKYKIHPKKYTTELWIQKAREVHGDKYDYSKVEYVSPFDEVVIICPKHGEFKQKASYHLSGNGCRECGYERVSNFLTGNKEEFIKKSNVLYDNKYDYSKVNYINNKTEVTVICPEHGEFQVRPDNHLTGRSGCPQCSVRHSIWEKDVLKFISSIYDGICVLGDRNVLGGMELDIYLPGKNIAFECDGLKWHSEEFKDKNYHLLKYIKCKEKGIQLIHIFEDEWGLKTDVVKNRIRSLLGANSDIIYARNCKVRGISSIRCKDFIDKNHLQGWIPSDYAYGLYYEGKLVSVMTFGYNRINLGGKKRQRTYELLRFCSNGNITVVGGASKLLKHFIRKKNPKEIVSYCDLRWSDGNLYEKLGFTLSHISRPNYFYIVNNTRKNRFIFRKDVLVKEGYDPGKTEHEIMLERGIYRIYDCGCKVYNLRLN